MKIEKIRIKNYRSIKDSGDIVLTDNLFVLAGQNESGKSSILEALKSYEDEESSRDTLNFEMENDGHLVQEISCTYSELDSNFFDYVFDDMLEYVNIEITNPVDLEIETIINDDLRYNLTQFTITRIFDFSNKKVNVLTKLDEVTLGKLKKHIKKYKIEEKDGENIKTIFIPYINIDLNTSEIADIFFSNTIQIVLFNDFTALLPDKILLDDIENKETEGYDAVKNLAALLTKDFISIAKKIDRQRKSTTEDESKIISANFQNDWQQKIYGNNTVKIIFDIQNNDIGQQEIIFSVQTKDNEYLAPRKRSKGMIWFLSLWLELKAKENSDNLLLLFDEPGLHLHIKANKDMLNVFHKLIERGHQIIYSTHSPSLIETDKLHNIGLVLNTEKYGTLVEGLTTAKINTENKKDALQPIAEAMGMEPLKDFSVLKGKNVLLEGISDFWYLKGMINLLGRQINYEFIPGVGIKGNQLKPLISFCIGYGLEWLILMDNGSLPNKLRTELKEELFAGNETDTLNKIRLIPVDEIENLFDVKDLILIDSTIKESTKLPIDLIGSRNKVLFSKLFFTKVLNKEISKSNLQKTTIQNFEEIFKWIEMKFSNTIV